MEQEDLQARVRMVIRKAANVVGYLAHPSSDSHCVYELSCHYLRYIFEKEEIPDAESSLNQALTQLELAIEEAVKDSPKRD